MNEMNMDRQDAQNMPNTQSTMPQGTSSAPENMKVDERAIKKIAGEAISGVDGVLGLAGGLTDVLKSSDDVTKGLAITTSSDGASAEVSAKIVTEYGKNIPDIVSQVQGNITKALQEMAGLTVDKVEVEVTDTMTADEYQEKMNKRPSLS